jgi:hypothetical protein
VHATGNRDSFDPETGIRAEFCWYSIYLTWRMKSRSIVGMFGGLFLHPPCQKARARAVVIPTKIHHLNH